MRVKNSNTRTNIFWLKGRFVLEDGSLFEGVGFGYKDSSAIGEVVFNTGMVGYVETLQIPPIVVRFYA